MKLTKLYILLFLAFALPVYAGDTSMPATGEKAPSTSISNLEGKATQLSEAIAGKPTLLIFFRGGWCPYCNLHLAELQKIESQLKDLGFQIVAVSPDKAELLKKNAEKNKLSYSLYSDSKLALAEAYGLAYMVDEKTHSNLKRFGIDLEERSGESHKKLPHPAAFLINEEGIVKFAHSNADYKVRLSTEELLAQAKEAVGKK